MNDRIRTFLALGLAASLLAAACGGGDDESASPAPGNGAAETPATGPAGSASPAGATPAKDAGGASDDLPAELKKLQEQAAKLTYTAIYTFADTEQGTESELTLAQDPPKNYVAGTLEGQTFIFINDGTQSYTCFKFGDTGICTKGSNTGGPFVNPNNFGQVDTQATFRKLEDRKVGGFDSRCWESRLKTEPEAVTFCVARSEPVTTLVEGAGIKMELKSFTKRVESKLFEPPYPVQ